MVHRPSETDVYQRTYSTMTMIRWIEMSKFGKINSWPENEEKGTLAVGWSLAYTLWRVIRKIENVILVPWKSYDKVHF